MYHVAAVADICNMCSQSFLLVEVNHIRVAKPQASEAGGMQGMMGSNTNYLYGGHWYVY